jgi:hypothetical protein
MVLQVVQESGIDGSSGTSGSNGTDGSSGTSGLSGVMESGWNLRFRNI